LANSLNAESFLLAAAGLFIASILFTSQLSFTITTPKGQFVQEASAQEEEVADDGGGREPANEATPVQLLSPTTRSPDEESPNILLIISDDQPFYTNIYTPAIVNEIFAKGTMFSDAFLSTSLCCPSRASILTGLYAHNHGVIKNNVKLTNTTFFQAIDDANLDYRTAMVGKYMNSQNGDCREEFDYWVAFPGSSGTILPAEYRTGVWYNGTNEVLNVNCQWTKFNNTYSTYLLRDYALQFLNATITEGKPFVMQFSPYNPHIPTTPAPEDANLYPDGLPSYYLPPSFNEADVSDKPEWVQELSPRCKVTPISECEEAYKEEQLKTARNLASLDRSVEALLNFLDSKGELSNTLIIYISDNGRQGGEHRIFGQKNVHYKESVKAVMGVRWDGHIPIGQADDLVGNIDIAPTIYDALGLTAPYPLDGRSLLDLWGVGSEPWRQSFLLEHWFQVRKHPSFENITHIAASIVTKEWSYTETKGDKSELYHRENDPYELNNLWCSPDDPSCTYSGTITELAAELRLLRPSWDSDIQCPC
jgi:N-acetylglucosamine-6-sulfatase